MKKDFLKYILMAGIVMLTSCMSNDKFLEEKLYGKLFPESFYSNKAEMELANNALYKGLSDAFHSYYVTFMRMLYSGDDITSPISKVDTYIYSAADEDLTYGWRRAYETINRANGIIENYHRAEGTLDGKELLYYAGQAHFVRAYMYFWLVRIFNEVPYVTTVRVSDRTRELTPVPEIYEYIIEDLKLAEQWLPRTWDGIDQVKHNGAALTEGAAKATLASVYLTMAGYPALGGNLGVTECYRLAKEKAAEIINNEADYGYRLIAHCADLWKPRPILNDEMVFALVYDGVSCYNVSGPAYCRPMDLGGWGGLCAEINFFIRFPAGERKEATFIHEFPFKNGNLTLPWPENEPMTSWEEMNWNPFINKYWEVVGSEGPTKWEKNFPDEWRSDRTNQMIRYAEVLLIYAEAQAMADGSPNDQAYDCINRVRNRAYAGVGSTGKELQRGLSATAFRDSVFVERGWEFAGFEYASRWFDLVRFELVEDAIQQYPVNSFLPGRNAKDGTYIRPPSKPESYFHPRPEEEVLLNPNLAN